jgi:hypothetical protein
VEIRRKLASHRPFGRIGSREEIAPGVIYLLENGYLIAGINDVKTGC